MDTTARLALAERIAEILDGKVWEASHTDEIRVYITDRKGRQAGYVGIGDGLIFHEHREGGRVYGPLAAAGIIATSAISTVIAA